MSEAIFAHCVEVGGFAGCGAAYTEREWKALPDHGARPKGARARRCTRCGLVFLAYPWLRDRDGSVYEGDSAT